MRDQDVLDGAQASPSVVIPVMARKLSHIPGVEIDEGRFKYVLIQVHTLDHQFRTFLRGNAQAVSHIENMLGALPDYCTLITVIDGHPDTL